MLSYTLPCCKVHRQTIGLPTTTGAVAGGAAASRAVGAGATRAGAAVRLREHGQCHGVSIVVVAMLAVSVDLFEAGRAIRRAYHGMLLCTQRAVAAAWAAVQP